MAAKKYLSLEEAAERLALPAEKVNALRADGELRGFADRGTWKFKADDIEEFGRSLQVNSDPDVPLLDDGDSLEIEMPDASDGGSALDDANTLEIQMPGDDGLADEPTIVRGSADDASDSDVRLAVDSEVGDVADAPSGPIDLSDSDSDVRLISDESSVLISGGDEGSDSDVRLVAGDNSAIALADDDDSDVTLVGDSAASGSSAVGASVLDDDQPEGGFEDSQLTLGADSGIMLDSPLDSGIALEGTSGVSIRDDSDVSLADEGSGIALADDSSVISEDDLSGGEDGSSIILLGEDSGIALAGDSDAAAGLAASQLGGATEADLEALDEDGYSVADDDAGGADTSVILFEDDDEDDFADAESSDGQNTSQFELEEDFDEFESDDDDETVRMSSAEMIDAASDDDMDVFEASDADFEDDDFQSGASRAEFAPAGYAAAPEAEFDGVTVSLLSFATLALLVVGVLSFDLVRSMWGVNEPSTFSQTILDSIGSSLYGG
ncbi:MAG: helix-turn-helix domain-containing protein [Planctomycetota bacterium]